MMIREVLRPFASPTALFSPPQAELERVRYWELGITPGRAQQLINSAYCQAWAQCTPERSVNESGLDVIRHGFGRVLASGGAGVVNGYLKYGPVKDKFLVNFLWDGGAKAPRLNIDRRAETGSSVGGIVMGPAAGPNILEQTFIPTTGRLRVVEVSLGSVQSSIAGDMVILRILDNAGSVLASASRWVDHGYNGYLRFGLPAGGIPTTPGSPLRIRLDAATSNAFAWRTAIDAYPGGQAYWNGAPYAGGNYDFGFRTYTDEAISTSTRLVGRVLWNGSPVAGAPVQVKAYGNFYSTPPLAEGVTGADGGFLIEAPPEGYYSVYALAPSSEYWAWTGRSLQIEPGVTTDAGSFSLSKKLQLLSPANGSTVSVTTPTLQWAAFPGATSYSVTVYNNRTFAPAFTRSGIIGTQVTVTPPLTSGEQYQWSVHAENSNGQIAYWSAWIFNVQ